MKNITSEAHSPANQLTSEVPFSQSLQDHGPTANFQIEPTDSDLWRANRLLFVTGPHASGKSAAVREAFPDEGQHNIFDLGPIIREAHKSNAPSITLGEWLLRSEGVHGPNFTNELLAQSIIPEIEDSPAQEGTILIGNRSMNGVNYLREKIGYSESRIVYIRAPEEILFERYKAREGMQDLTPDDFRAILDREASMGLPEIEENADIIFDNVSTLQSIASSLRLDISNWRGEGPAITPQSPQYA